MKVKIDGIEVDVEKGETILDAARKAGIRIPTLCFFERVYNEGTCRVCIVELSNGKVVPSCSYPVSDGLEVYTKTERIMRDRRIVLELILAGHKIQCHSCPRKGDCNLWKVCKEAGILGFPVCVECPLHGEDCLLYKGEVCMGPLTMAGCNAECTREGGKCVGCRGPITRRDVLEESVRKYKEVGIPKELILEDFGRFFSSFKDYGKVIKVLEELL
ncbi:MAG: 2Fe-2S iron-sulfur cluster-binding protein [Candidatus Asgardarchaeia archaeon]